MYQLNQVFMIGWEYPPHNSGGLGVACQGLTEALAEQHHQLYFSLPYQYPGQVGHMEILDCTHPDWALGKHQPPFFAYEALPAVRRLEHRLDMAEFYALPQSDLERQVNQYHDQVLVRSRDKKFQIIHAHDWMSLPAGVALKKRTNRPLVAHIHSTEFDRSPTGGSRYIMKTEYDGLMQADGIIAVSDYTKRVLIDKYQVDPGKVYVVHNGVSPIPSSDPGRHHFASSRPMVVFMGRLTGQKGPEYFIQLAQSVLKQVPEAIFVMAGNGDLYQELLLTSAGQGLSGKILFSGFVRDQQKDKLLDRADVFVMPSLSEPFGLVAVEAAQRSTPVIISKTSGVSEVLPHSLRADFWDIDLMTQQIVKLLTRPQLSQQVVADQHQDLKPLTWKSAAQKVRSIYQRLARK